MIKSVVIIEDEKLNADRLIRLLKEIRPKIRIMAVIESIADTVNWLNSNPQPDVIMMDVRLCDGLSFEIFDKTEIKCPVIFTTAYDEYAVKAFKYNSIDYLLKPIEPEELKTAVEKLESSRITFNLSALDGLTSFLSPKKYRTRFLLPYRDGYKTLLVGDVLFFYSELRITRACLQNGTEDTVPQTLEELEQQLDPKHFFRANRQFIIHIDAIEKVHNHFNGKLKVSIRKNPDVELIISRERAGNFKNWLDF